VRRTAVYEKDRVAAVSGAALPAELFDGLVRFPAQIRFLAAGLERAGIPLAKGLVLDRSPAAQAL